MTDQKRVFPTPIADPDTEQFWSAAKDHKLMIGSCNSCGEKHYYPRGMCPHCGGSDVELVQSSGKGEIYSWSVLRRAEPPFAISKTSTDISDIVAIEAAFLKIAAPFASVVLLTT